MLTLKSSKAKLYIVSTPGVFGGPWDTVVCFKHIDSVLTVKAKARNLDETEYDQHMESMVEEERNRDIKWTGCFVCDHELETDYALFFP